MRVWGFVHEHEVERGKRNESGERKEWREKREGRREVELEEREVEKRRGV